MTNKVFMAGIEFIIIECASCQMPFAITKKFQDKRQRDHKTFCCPFGHHNYYPVFSPSVERGKAEKGNKNRTGPTGNRTGLQHRSKATDQRRIYMKLQFDPPDRPGWWWYREGPECDWWPYHVTRHVAGYLEIEDPARPSGKYRCWIEDWWGYGIEGSQWAGPIKEPEG